MMHVNNCLGNRIEYDDSVVKDAGFNPYYLTIASGQDDPLIVNGRKMINLSTNNYLGLSNDERLKEAYIEAIRKYGVSMCATPIAGGYTELFGYAKQKLTSFIGIEDLLLYPSCYQANNGIFLSVARKEDLILFDRYSHSSLIQGIRSVGCRALPFNHNNMECLEYLLIKSINYPKVFVVTESVFSTEGSIAPFKEIYNLCKKYNAVPVIDDSHGIGVIGKDGRGILAYSQIDDFDGIYTASLGKAMANNCGVVGGKSELIRYLSFFSSHLVYSTSISPSVLAGIPVTIDILNNEYAQRAGKVYRNAELIKNSLKENGYEVSMSEAPINSIVAHSSQETINIAKDLFLNDILSTPFIYPSVPKNEGKIRLIAGANIKEDSIEKVFSVFKKIRRN